MPNHAQDLTSGPPSLPDGPVGRVLEWARFDLSPSHRAAPLGRLALATAASLVGSLLGDALVVVAFQALFPSTRGYPHFQFGDYARLTVVGVLVACAAWPVVVRLCSAPRWMFLRMAAAVTLVLWLPDVLILVNGQPPKAVAGLFVMHLVIAMVTYNALVRLAPPRAGR